MKKGKKKTGGKRGTGKAVQKATAKKSTGKKSAKKKPAIARRATNAGKQKTMAVSVRISEQEDTMTPKDVLKLAKENKALMVDFKFMDYPGLWQHFSVPVDELTEGLFEDG
ncbi:MAG TPA: glutamine synthetase, partial [Nitrospirota bacterium]|nr:glutamine synthetase [Nitrospirota bacterium]